MEILKPTDKQMKFMDWEFGVFFHFGIRTFYEGHRDWDGREHEMTPDGFNPKKLDCNQWIETVKKAGAKYAIFTTKHHDGFSNWPSKYSSYSVRETPYKDGKGDIVKEFTDACRSHGLGVGLYYSPAQVGFKAKNPKDYDDYFVNQITELLSNYGKIDYLWFDGCGSEDHEYDKDRIIKVIRGLQPDILIFSMWDPDTRWVGNEEGVAPFGSFYTVSEAKTSINETEDKSMEELKFLPYECDCRIRRKNWFYSEKDEDMLRDSDDLMGLYYYSIGRGGNLLLNVAPDRDGLIPDIDSKRLEQFSGEIKRRFSNPVPYTLERDGNVFKLILETPQNINCAVLAENLANGQRINAFDINMYVWSEITLFSGKAVGHKQICPFPDILAKEIHIEITDYYDGYELCDIKLYNIK